MNIIIDTSPLQNASAVRGIGRYTKELVSALRNLKTKHTFHVSSEVNTDIDLVHYPFFDLFFPTLPLFKKYPTVVTIHDVIPLLLSNHYPSGFRGKIQFIRQRIALMSVRHIITDSSCSKRDIHQYLKIPLDKITAIPLASSSDMKNLLQPIIHKVRKKYELYEDYMLYVGDIGYNKNLIFLLHVLKQLPKITLVMVGKQMKNILIPEGKDIEDTIIKLGLQKRVIRLDSIDTNSNEELCALYSGSRVYVQPSLYEGFGLPVIEAMACRTVVVCSVGGSLPEVAGNAAIYFHPRSETECKNALLKAWNLTKEERKEYIERGHLRAQQFSWERTAQETLSVYEKFLY